jgi:hypothetical protein
MDAALEARLQDLIRAEGRSLLQYVSESFPWTKAPDQTVRDQVLSFARADADALARLSRHLAKERVRLPHPGSYPMSFTTVNFVSLDYLLPRLIEEQRARVAAVERLCNALPEGPVKNLVGELLVLKRQHLSQLGAFMSGLPAKNLAS